MVWRELFELFQLGVRKILSFFGDHLVICRRDDVGTEMGIGGTSKSNWRPVAFWARRLPIRGYWSHVLPRVLAILYWCLFYNR